MRSAPTIGLEIALRHDEAMAGVVSRRTGGEIGVEGTEQPVEIPVARYSAYPSNTSTPRVTGSPPRAISNRTLFASRSSWMSTS